ncbi:protein TASOR 2 isoform X2 [Hyla sarda]|uniref:protein TASOR 2 isoform X2 n=1 Tax=Hyla sarda TaxID=327740 RepID=UPI0024C2686D|nr:protein TASOR 2 isoform X2 [Hyla sarda]
MQYNAWKGQLYIHEQLVCNIALHTTSACGIPAQLPQKLELKEVIQLSEIRTKLPEDVFQKTDFTGQEVSCGNIYYSFYPVIATDIVGSELEKLLKCLKDQDLALIKVLNDQGFLVLVSSAVFQNSTGIYDGNSAQLNALFLFPHQKVLDKKEREEWEDKFIRKELPLTISNLLPGLHYAIIESCKLQKDKALYPGPLVEQYFRKYAVLQSKKDSLSERKPEQKEPLSICHSHTDDLPKKCSQLAFSCLQLYVSSPVNFSVPLIKMSNIFAENIALSSNSDQCSKTLGNLIKQDSPSKRQRTTGSKAVSDQLQERPATSQDKQPPKKNTKRKSVKRRGKKGKKKPDQRSTLTTAEAGENQTTNKRRRLVSEGKEQKSEATIKLVSAPYPQRRKRGAEVLTAAFIQDERIQPTEKIALSKPNEENNDLSKKAITRKPRKTLPPEEHLLFPNRSSKRKASKPGNKNISAGVVNKPEVLRRTSERNSGKTVKTFKRSQEKIQNSTVVQTNPLSKSSDNLRYAKKSPLSAQISGDSMIEKRISMYESHALNLLADLALNSFGSTSIPYLKTGNMASANESLVEEAACTGDTVSTVEHSQDCSLPTQSNLASSEPEPVLESESHKPKTSSNVSPRNIASQKRMEIGEKQLSQKAHIAAAKAKARFNATSKICLEHSYSQLPIEDIPAKSTKEANEQPIQVAPDTTTPPEVVPEPSTNGLSGDPALLGGESVCPATDKKQREVSKFQDKFAVTFHWEPVYDFDLDSKFTSDPLEKTVNRALHGPWNPNLKEKLEDVKIILHMWIALFYSKCNKQINCSSRKVVEHSNPAKYVSINTVLDPFEFYEIMESDGAPSAENTNAIISIGKMSEAPLDSDLSCKSGKSRNKNLQDLNIPSSIPTKDYNIKLASEIFQVCKDSESAFYSDSLQTSMTCRMAPTSQGAQIPANIMNIIYGTNVPTVCYIGDTNLFNTEQKDKSENCINIGGFSSEKVRSKEIEHKYSRDFSSVNEIQKSADSQIKSSDVDKKEESVKVGDKARSGYTRLTYSDMINICNLKMTPNIGGCKTTSKLEFAGKIVEYPCAESTTHSDINKDSANEDLPSVDLSKKDENSKDLDKDELPVHTSSQLDARMHRGDDNHRTAEGQDLVQASALLPQEVHDSSGSDESDGSPDDTLQNSEDSQMAITSRFSALGLNSPFRHSDVSTELCMDKSSNMVDPLLNEEAPKCDRDSSGIWRADTDNLPTAGSPDTNVHSTSIPSEDFTNSTSSLGPQKTEMEGLEFCKNPDILKNVVSNMSVDYDSICTMEGKTDSAWDSAGFKERQEKAVEDIPDKLGDLVEPENTQKLNENVLIGISATDLMSRLELSFSSDESSDVECTTKSYVTDHMKSGEQQTISKSSKDSSEKTVGHEELSTAENEISTSGEDAMPAGCMDNSLLPEKETDVNEASHTSEASTVDKAKMEVPEKQSLPLNIAQSCLSGDDADFPYVAATDEGTKEPEPSNHDGILNSEGSLPEASKKAFPCTEEKPDSHNAVTSAEKSHNGTCFDDLSSPGADKNVMDGVPSTSFLGDLDMDVSIEKHKEHAEEEKIAESQNHPLISLAPSEGEMITDIIHSMEPVNEEDNLSGSAVKEMQIDPDTRACDTVEKDSVSLSENTLDGKLDETGSNENTLGSDITNSFSDLLMSKWSEMDLERPPMEKQQPDLTGDAVYLSTTVNPTRTSAKDSSHSSRNSCSNKKDILSKLKRICLGSVTSNQVTSSSEIVLSHDKNGINSSVTKELNEVIDGTKNELPLEDESTLESCDDVGEETTIENPSQEESAITSVNAGELESLEGVMPPQEDSLILPSLEDVSDSIEQDASPERPDICFIVNTGSISKEQYDRWSETSDDDIEYIRSYKEPLLDQEYSQKETHQSLEFLDNVKCSQDQTTTIRIEKISKKQPGFNSGLYETDAFFSSPLQDGEYNSSTNHENVTVTRNIKEADRALHTINKETSRSDLNHIFSDRRMGSDDLTRNTLDMENVRFMCKMKEILRKSSTNKHIYGPPFQTVFESRRIPSCSRFTTKSGSPLRITVQCPYRRTDFRRHDSWHPNPYNSSPYYGDELWDRPVTYSRTIRKVRTPRYSSFHLNQLRYENTLDKSPTEISGILNECVQSNHVKLSSVGLGSTVVDRTSAIQLPEEDGWQTRRKCVPVSSKSKAVKTVISDLCTSLRSRLQSVARAPEQKIYFYIYETDDEDFISSTKSLLVKDGLISTNPRDFLSSEHSESHQLLVIIKNEDVFSCINKIPYLRQLKLLPNVIFAGVDTPEDMIESSYEELFKAGGFVASDKSLLENITLGKLKDVLVVLEKMNRTSPWKWLIHYRENRKLKENKRAEAQFQTKMSLLKSYQQSNFIEILPYHQCDSRSKEPSNDLSCLLNLQYQHIHSRLAVYLTGTSCTVTEEYEQNGILVYDVDTFLRRIQKMDLQFQASHWS